MQQRLPCFYPSDAPAMLKSSRPRVLHAPICLPSAAPLVCPILLDSSWPISPIHGKSIALAHRLPTDRRPRPTGRRPINPALLRGCSRRRLQHLLRRLPRPAGRRPIVPALLRDCSRRWLPRPSGRRPIDPAPLRDFSRRQLQHLLRRLPSAKDLAPEAFVLRLSFLL